MCAAMRAQWMVAEHPCFGLVPVEVMMNDLDVGGPRQQQARQYGQCGAGQAVAAAEVMGTRAAWRHGGCAHAMEHRDNGYSGCPAM